MAGRRELGLPKTDACTLKEQLLRTTLRNVRSQGHISVELRKDGKRTIFFCTLCLAPCYSDSSLFDHLKGNLHTKRYAAVKATLLKSNPWPFNDGVYFFHDSTEQDMHLPASNDSRGSLLDTPRDDENNHAAVSPEENLRPPKNGHVSHNGFVSKEKSYSVGVDSDCGNSSCDMDGNNLDLVIPGVLHKDEISDLEVRFMGVGKIAARFCEEDGVSRGISRIWCEWLGMKDSGDEDAEMIPEHDFAVVTFAYNYDLGRKGFLDDLRYMLSSSPRLEMVEMEGPRKKKKMSFSDPEDMSESLSNQYDSCGEESLSSNCSSTKSLLDGYDDLFLNSRVMLSKSVRKELRHQKRIAAERMCDLCQHKMLPGKDVATLLNKKTGRIVCSSRNVNGAFHLCHISCLLHWILLCEFELCTKQMDGPVVKRRSRRKTGAKFNETGNEAEKRATRNQIYSVFCPDCQGTGIDIDGDELEKPTVTLSEMFKYKIKASDARRAWMKSPEVLQNCSVGFHFPSQSEETIQEKVSPLKLLHFYRADK